MRNYCLFIGIISSGISGVVVAIIGLINLFVGEVLTGLASIFLAAPMSFAMMITFSFVLERIDREEPRGFGKPGDRPSREHPTATPTSDTAGTPWANNPGATDER